MAVSTTVFKRYGNDVPTVFDLLGVRENDLTAALGYTLARSGHLIERLLDALEVPGGVETEVRLETREDVGRTDLEIETETSMVIVEAKKGWNLPQLGQLELYAKRLDRSTAQFKVLATLSDCSMVYAERVLPPSVNGIKPRHLPWSDVKGMISGARLCASGHEKLWLSQLGDYLRRSVRVRPISDSWVYCVAIAVNGRPGSGGSRTYRDFVVEESRYFHPTAKGWPTDPPNFLAFRWRNHVQVVRRVESYRIIGSLQDEWPDVPVNEETARAHALYTLGPPIPLSAPIPVGPKGVNYRASRAWVLLDQLLTAGTLQDAILASKALTGSA